MRTQSRKKISWSNSATVKRYFKPFWGRYRHYLTPRKLYNAILVEFELQQKSTTLVGKPYVLHLELTNICNLRCPGCVTGNRSNPLSKGHIKFEEAKAIVDKVKDYVVFARLDGTGESFLNGDFFKIVEYIHSQGIGTSVSTNLQSNKPGDIDALVRSGLDYLIVSIDGASQAVYEKYRSGGSLDRALTNLGRIVAKKKELRSAHPFVEWQFLMFDHNQNELPEVVEMARAVGVDRLLTSDLRTRQTDLPESKNVYVGLSRRTRNSSCYWLWKVLNVTWNGDCKTCCTDGLAEQFSMGNLLKSDLESVWNGRNYQTLRELFCRDRADWDAVKACKCYARCPLVFLSREKGGLRALGGGE